MQLTKPYKKILSLFIATVMVFGLLPSIGSISVSAADTWDGTTIATGFSGGDGSESNPWQIATGAELAYLAQEVNNGSDYSGKYFVLIADINLNDKNWTPIGIATTPNIYSPANVFGGNFNGDGHEITGLFINANYTYAGLFGYVSAAGTIKNLGVSGNVTNTVNSTLNATAAIVGILNGNISNCYSSCVVSGQLYVGGIAGSVGGSIRVAVSNCYNTGDIRGTDNIGGIAGSQHFNLTISDCYSTGNVDGQNGVGGIVGQSRGNVKNCYNTGNITFSGGGGDGKVGGIVGWNGIPNSGHITISDCYNTGNVTGGLDSEHVGRVGGIVGDNYNSNTFDSSSTIIRCFNTGKIEGKYSYIGGIAGRNATESTNTGANSAKITTAIIDCYNMGKIIGTPDEVKGSFVGGIVGSNSASANPTSSAEATSKVENCYNVGEITPASGVYSGAIAGRNKIDSGAGTQTASITNSYYNIDITTNTNAIGIDNTSTTVTSLTTAQMTDNDALSTMTGLTTAFTKRQNTVSHIYYPELTDFYNSTNTVVSNASKTSVEISTGVYIITYNLDGGTQAINAETTYIGSTAYTLPIPTKIGYIFDGWYVDSAFTGFAVTAIYDTDTGNKEYWAKWKSTTISNGYILTVTAGMGGMVSNANGSYTAGTPVSIIATPYTGYRFVGWVTSNGGTFSNASSAVTVFTMPDNDTIVTAIFERISSPNPNSPIPINPTNPAPLYTPPSDTFNSSSGSSNDNTGSNPPVVDNTITVTTDDGLSITFTYTYTPTGGIVLTASAAAIRKVANSGDDSAILSIPLPSGKYIEISFDNVALEAIAKQAGKLGNITITIEIVDKAKLSRKERQLVGDDLVFEFIIMGVRKGERITDLKGGTMTVTLSRGLTSGENNHDRTIFYRDSENQIKKSGVGKYHARKNGTNNVVSFTFTEL